MVENITPQLGEFFGVKNGNGVLVRSVDKGSRAEKAGFHAGDIIVKVNDQPVHDTSDFSHAVRSRNSDSVSVGVIRDKREQISISRCRRGRNPATSCRKRVSTKNLSSRLRLRSNCRAWGMRSQNWVLRLNSPSRARAKLRQKCEKNFVENKPSSAARPSGKSGRYRKDLENLRIQLKTVQHDWL